MSGTTNWTGPFKRSHFCGPVDRLQNDGLVVAGVVQKTRVQSVFVHDSSVASDQADNLPTRFIVVILPVKLAHKRYFDKYDQELDYQSNKVARGKNQIQIQPLSHDELASKVNASSKSGNAIPDKLLDNASHLHPKSQGTFEFWVDVAKVGAKELAAGDELRIFTMGPSIFVERFVVMNAKAKDKVTGGWSTAMSSQKEKDDTKIDGGDKEGVDEEEWED